MCTIQGAHLSPKDAIHHPHVGLEPPCENIHAHIFQVSQLLSKAFVQTTLRRHCKGQPKAKKVNKDNFWSFDSTFGLTKRSGQPACSLGKKVLAREKDTSYLQNFNVIKKFPCSFPYFFIFLFFFKSADDESLYSFSMISEWDAAGLAKTHLPDVHPAHWGHLGVRYWSQRQQEKSHDQHTLN